MMCPSTVVALSPQRSVTTVDTPPANAHLTGTLSGVADHNPAQREQLDRIARANEAVEAARVELGAAVRAAHDGGLSYSRIADQLGVSRQAVWERFGKPRLSSPEG
jgi:DNA-directed RNA polymerase specialized sigma24 family protein